MSKTFDIDIGEFVLTPAGVGGFLDELRHLYLKYNVSIEHEDCGGSFILVTPYKPEALDRLRACSIQGFNKLEK